MDPRTLELHPSSGTSPLFRLIEVPPYHLGSLASYHQFELGRVGDSGRFDQVF